MRKLYEVKRDHDSGKLTLVAHELMKVERDCYKVGPRRYSIPRYDRVGIGISRKAAIDSFMEYQRKEIARFQQRIAEHAAALKAAEAL
jgi:hypothetical protein